MIVAHSAVLVVAQQARVADVAHHVAEAGVDHRAGMAPFVDHFAGWHLLADALLKATTAGVAAAVTDPGEDIAASVGSLNSIAATVRY